MSLPETLHPRRAPNMSGKMVALLGYLFGKTWTDPEVVDVYVTTDGTVLARQEGEVGHNQFVGGRSDLARNLREWFDLHELTDEEKAELRRRTAERFGPDVEDLVFSSK